MGLLPYAALVLPPLVRALASQEEEVRAEAAAAFAALMPLLPLEADTPDPAGMPPRLSAARREARALVAPLLGGSKPAPFQLPVPIYAELRPYQQEGVNWLAFLRQYGLHGVLSDEMGLGKTLQTLCILAASRHDELQRPKPRPSLVVCPATLVSHWRGEAARYVGELLEAIEYAGPPAKRAAMRPRLPAAALVVVSYETLRSDAAPLSAVSWDYLVLDEGHVIKNGSSKVARAAKSLRGSHRLLLSGTPIQNDALEMWSLFDFLMPGYLGQRRHFHSQYVKPISASYGASAGDAAHAAGEAALKRLHRQVLPFCLRRTKAAVLQDLPPKVIVDRLVPLSAVQALLYCAFAQSPAQGGVRRAIDKAAEGGGRRGGGGKGGGGRSGDGGGGGGGDGSSEGGGGGGEGAATVLHALQYLRKVCNHPLLVLDEAHPLRAQCEAAAAAEGCTLHSLAVAPKLEALRQLLAECGIGAADASAAEPAAAAADDAALAGGGGGAAALAAHRALVFAQSASMLDRVEADLLAACLPSVSHVRLDGRVAVARRGELVERFNSDPSIDLMLLTTAVGGLGLNLTSADTVIFLDHDWNPMRDMQAMANE